MNRPTRLACAVCGWQGASGAFWFLLAPMVTKSPRWPKRARVYRECPECGQLQTAQRTARDLLEAL